MGKILHVTNTYFLVLIGGLQSLAKELIETLTLRGAVGLEARVLNTARGWCGLPEHGVLPLIQAKLVLRRVFRPRCRKNIAK